MPGQGRLGDKGKVDADAHGCPACPHPALGPAIVGSPTVFCNDLPALRVDDVGIHAACCGPNVWVATQGAQTVFIDNKPAHRMNDAQRHCGGAGRLIEGSTNVIIEDSTGGSGGGAAGGAAGGAGAGAAGNGAGAGGPGTTPDGGAGPDPGGSQPAGAQPGEQPDQPDTPIEPDEIEVRVVNATGEPVDGIRYELTMPDGSVRSGFADAGGVITLTGLDQRGECTIVFPEIDEQLSDAP